MARPANNANYKIQYTVKSSIVGLICLFACAVHAGEMPDTLVQSGQKTYRDGTDGSQNTIMLTLGESGDPILATAFPCANCHGREGEGKQEGGLTIPAILHLLNENSKQAYDETSFKRAITQGINTDNKPLSAAMPRYRLSDAQAKALWAYLKQLETGQASDPGVTDKEIKLGALLPLTGHLASTGKILHETLAACLSEANNRGLIYGRKLVLAMQDSGSTNEEILASARHLNTKTKPFAVLPSYLPEMTPELEKLFAQESLPVIAPITFSINEKTDDRAPVFYFLPDHLTQARTLIEYWRSQLAQEKHPAKPRLLLIYREETNELKLANALLNLLSSDKQDEKPQFDIRKYPDKITAPELIKAKPDGVLLLGGKQALSELKKNLDKTSLRPILLGLFDRLGTDELRSFDDSFAKIILASSYSNQDGGVKWLADRLGHHSVKLENPGLQRLACSAVDLVAQALKKSGKRLTRTKFIKALEGINGFQTGITPPLYYSQGNHHGRPGAYLYTVSDPLDTSITQIGWFSW